MDNHVTIVLDDQEKTYHTLHALWKLNDTGDIIVHGATVVHRDRFGHINVALQHTDAGVRTAVGVRLGALIGALAGPIGTAVAIGAAAGGAAYRHPVSQVREASFLGDDYHHYLHPRDYNPNCSDNPKNEHARR